MTSIEDTLKVLDTWYREPSQGSERPKLLSKLAIIELCGWIEVKWDRIIAKVDDKCLQDKVWVKVQIIDKTFGFDYERHFRAMLIALVGEVFARRVEKEMDSTQIGSVDQLRSLLGSLWKVRCAFAHADVATNIATQQTFQSPSWALNQHRLLSKLFDHLECCVDHVLSAI